MTGGVGYNHHTSVSRVVPPIAPAAAPPAAWRDCGSGTAHRSGVLAEPALERHTDVVVRLRLHLSDERRFVKPAGIDFDVKLLGIAEAYGAPLRLNSRKYRILQIIDEFSRQI
jgi:hypothetical protein